MWQCVESGLVDGSKIFVDSSYIDANASKNSVVDTKSLKRFSNERYKELETRLEEMTEARHGEINRRYISTTDPEAGIVRRNGNSPKLCYQTHRAVDVSSEVVTAAKITRGDINEAHHMISLWGQHHYNTNKMASTIVADSKYGTIDNFLSCYDMGINAHMPDLQGKIAKHSRQDIYSESKFHYDAETDTYICPAGNKLTKRSYHPNRNSIDYSAKKSACDACEFRNKCTKNKSGRTIKRHIKQDELNAMRSRSKSNQAKKDIQTRKHLMERSFARGTRYGFDRARWRGLSRVAIQEYLVCAIQNIKTLIKYGNDHPKRAIQAIKQIEFRFTKAISAFLAKNTLSLKILFQKCKNLISQKNILRQPVNHVCSY